MPDANDNLNDLPDQDDTVAADADDAHETTMPVTPAEAEQPEVAPTAIDAPHPVPVGTTVAPGAAFARTPQPRQRGGFVAGVAALALACGLLGGIASSAVFNNTQGTTTSQSSTTSNTKGSGIKTTNTSADSNLTAVINAKLPSIVTIGVTGSQESGTGSGVVINSDGYIVTNAHVATLEGATASGSITVRTSSGDTYKATLVGYDATADVAVVKVAATARGITPITFANSDDVQVGDTTIAIGSPLGLSGTVTTGIVSALNRPIQVQSAAVNQPSSTQANPTVALSAIQTDAAINQGNSGGALLDGNGNLIGLNDAIATGGNGSTGSIGIGFAIPGDYVKRIAQQIIDKGSGQHGYLGVSLIDYAAAGASFATGAEVQSLNSASPAAKGGVLKGDVITKINDTVIEGSTQATAIIRQLMPDSKIAVTVTRGSSDKVLNVKLGSTAKQ